MQPLIIFSGRFTSLKIFIWLMNTLYKFCSDELVPLSALSLLTDTLFHHSIHKMLRYPIYFFVSLQLKVRYVSWVLRWNVFIDIIFSLCHSKLLTEITLLLSSKLKWIIDMVLRRFWPVGLKYWRLFSLLNECRENFSGHDAIWIDQSERTNLWKYLSKLYVSKE